MRLKPIASGVFIFFVVLVCVVGVLWAAGAAYENVPTNDTTVSGETLTADVGNYTALEAPDYALSHSDLTATNSTGISLTEGTDYEFNTSAGSLLFYDTESVADGETITVDYTYSARIETARRANDAVGTLLRVALPATLLIVLAVAIAGLAVAIVRSTPGRGSTNFGR